MLSDIFITHTTHTLMRISANMTTNFVNDKAEYDLVLH